MSVPWILRIIRRSFLGFFFVLGLFITALIGSCVLMAPTLPLLFIPVESARTFYRKWNSLIAACWFSASCFSLERWCGIKLKFDGDSLPFGENCLIISNHRTRIDWMFLWCLCLRYGQLSKLKIVLKEPLKSLPGFGWAMQMFLFIFLKRNDRKRDIEHIRNVLEDAVGRGRCPTLLLFPEGTNLSRANLEKSRAFSRRRGLPVHDHVLVPKVSGWTAAVGALRPALRSVVDVTMAYRDYRPDEQPSEKSLFQGRFPKEVHFLLERHDIKTIPKDEEQLAQWLRHSFGRKERALRVFYTGGQWEQRGGTGGAGRMHETEGEVVAAYIRRIFILSICMWVTTCALTAYGLIYSLWVRLYLLGACAAFVLLTRLAGGADALELFLHGPRGLLTRRRGGGGKGGPGGGAAGAPPGSRKGGKDE